MVVNTITEAKTQLSSLIERVLAGKPVAVLQKYTEGRKKREPGALKGQIRISDDFDDLPDNIADSFEML